MSDTSKLALAQQTGLAGVAQSVWLATYNPGEGGGSLTLHFGHGHDEAVREAYEIRQITSAPTGAIWYTLDGVHHTVESLAAAGPFTIPLSDYLGGCPYQQWIHAQENIKPLEAWFAARGDTVSAQMLRDTFPKLFAPLTVPEPQPEPQSRKSRWWRLF